MTHKTRPVILETDWYTDCDDVVAARLLANLHRLGVFRLLGVSINASFPDSVRSLDAFLMASGLDVPVAIVRDWPTEPRAKATYQPLLAKLSSKYGNNADAEEPVALYRRLLAAATEEVDIISIGFAENLARLLQSPPDGISPLDGLELVRRHVGELWMMAGRWDKEEGYEYNLRGDDGTNRLVVEAGSHVLASWPTPITLLGWEVGDPVISGALLPEEDILKQAMVAHGSGQGRSSWDPMTVLLAAAGSPKRAGYDEVRGVASSDKLTGVNRFRRDENGPHRFVVKAYPDAYYQGAIDNLAFPR